LKKEIIILLLICVFTIPSSSIVVGDVTHTSRNNNSGDISNLSASHTVLVEYLSNTTFKTSVTSDQLYSLYSSGKYNFQYVTLVTDKTKIAEKRAQELGLQSYPAVYFDGGYRIVLGQQSSDQSYIDAIIESSLRKTEDIEIQIDGFWIECPCHKDIAGEISVINNKNARYRGRLILSIVEINSRWEDSDGRPYDYAVLDYILDEEISIEKAPLGIYRTEYFWYAAGAGYPYLGSSDSPNLLLVATVFSNSVGLADATVVTRLFNDNPPEKPVKPVGVVKGKPGETYVYTTRSLDPDGNEIQYGWDWDGDYRVDEWSRYYPSGQEVNISHTWDTKGNYYIRVKSKDKLGVESFWSDPLPVSIPLNRIQHRPLLSAVFLRFMLKQLILLIAWEDVSIFSKNLCFLIW